MPCSRSHTSPAADRTQARQCPGIRTPQRPPLSPQKTSKHNLMASVALLWRCYLNGIACDPLPLLNNRIELLCFPLISKGFTLPIPYLAVIPLSFNPYKQGVCPAIDARRGRGMRHPHPHPYRIQSLPNFRKMDLQSAPCMAPRFWSAARKRQLT